MTISADAFANLPDGTYKPAIVFNDSYYTTITDGIIVDVINSKTTATAPEGGSDESVKEPEKTE